MKNVREVARGSLEIVKQYLKYLWMRNVFTEVSFKDIRGEGGETGGKMEDEGGRGARRGKRGGRGARRGKRCC